MKPKNRKHEAPHTVLPLGTQLRFADVIDEVSKLAANPIEAALVIERMFQRREVRFADDFASLELVI